MTTLPVHRLDELPRTITRHLDDAGRHRVLRLYTTVRDDILNGTLAPGHLVRAADLEDLLRPRMAVHTVTGALWLLHEDGLLETQAPYGTRVRVRGQEWTPPDDGTPLTVHVEKAVRERLADKTYPSGTRIPALHVLADEFGVSGRTVRVALMPLFADGYLAVSEYRRDGTRVTDLVARTPSDVLLRLSGTPAPPSQETDYTLWDETKSLLAWSRDRRCQVSGQLLRIRVRTERWPLERALTTPARTYAPTERPFGRPGQEEAGRPGPDPATAPSTTHKIKETVLDVALALHRSGRWKRTGMLEIAAAARVARQTLYNQFSHWDGITQALLARETGRLLDGGSRRWHQTRAQGADPADCLTAAACWMLAASRSHPLRRYLLPSPGPGRPDTADSRALADLLAEIRWRLAGTTTSDSHLHAVETVLRQALSYLLLPAESHRHARAQIAHTARRLLPPATVPAATGPVPNHSPALDPQARRPGPEDDHR
ncbi:GntR family transcriptional regulator [Streptomyces sp. 4F14]|uniref:GntR family transcriptional regulator n=1 Tax=Streptomyces sp. 4F14 TaxID=3394380 RepID=UPI003A8C3C6C